MLQSEGLIQKFAILYLIIWTISPPLGIDMKYRLLAIGCVGIWGVFALQRGYYIEKIHLYAAIFAVFVATVAYMEKGSIDGILKQIAIYMLIVCFLMYAFYQDGKWKEVSWIVPVVLILLIVFNYNTAQALIDDPGIARKIVRADENTYGYMRQGIGGYGLIYPQVCVFPALVAWIKSSFRESKISFVIGCVWIYTFVQYLISAGYSIAIYACVVGLIILFAYKGKNATKGIVISVFVFASIMAAIVYIDSFREALLKLFDGTEVVTKINDLVSTSQTGQAEDSISARKEAYMDSLRVLFQYPLIGSLWNGNGGGHSAIVDVFAKYGILGGVIYTKILFYVPNNYKVNYIESSYIRSISHAVIVSILYVAILNSFSFNFTAMLLLVLPILYEDIIRWEKIE